MDDVVHFQQPKRQRTQVKEAAEIEDVTFSYDDFSPRLFFVEILNWLK